ncbi:MAG TPA: RNA repair transcriptional activator RtcR family protein, partial [Phycisphaerales bacterium]|nr:RNA repair transcriptional activator RtcR family protein [Phycisphaerales bacterium]
MAKRLVVISMLGTSLDVGKGPDRWLRWRPNVAVCQQEDVHVARVELLYPRLGGALAGQLARDMVDVSPGTDVRLHLVDPKDPWDFEE